MEPLGCSDDTDMENRPRVEIYLHMLKGWTWGSRSFQEGSRGGDDCHFQVFSRAFAIFIDWCLKETLSPGFGCCAWLTLTWGQRLSYWIGLLAVKLSSASELCVRLCLERGTWEGREMWKFWRAEEPGFWERTRGEVRWVTRQEAWEHFPLFAESSSPLLWLVHSSLALLLSHLLPCS